MKSITQMEFAKKELQEYYAVNVHIQIMQNLVGRVNVYIVSEILDII